MLANEFLLEIYQTVFNMYAEGDAGPDGFNGILYKACWDITKQALVAAPHYFILEKYLNCYCCKDW